MKKFVCAILAMVMLIAVSATASAYEWITNDHNTAPFTLNVPTQAIADNQLYRYHANTGARELGGGGTVYIRHRVTQIDAGETNRMAAYAWLTQKTMGAHWHPSDNGFYPCTSNAIEDQKWYGATGRGNTNYASKYGLNTITLDGSLDPDMD